MKHLAGLLPFLQWSRHYTRSDLAADSVAGVVVLFITVPQVIAYAFLAGLPAEAGLYAALASLLIYSLFGSSRSLAVGPAAIIAMMTLDTTSEFAPPGTVAYAAWAVKLSMVTGLVLVGLRVINFGAIINFLSHAVITGFISAAAILIIVNQLPAILGVHASPDSSVAGVLGYLMNLREMVNITVIEISISALLLLVFCHRYLEGLFVKVGISTKVSVNLARSAPMYVVVLGIVMAVLFQWQGGNGVPIVGAIPTGLPEISYLSISIEEFQQLLPAAVLMALVVFMESTSVATAMAAKKRQKIEPNQELVGLGFANIGASLAGGLPVAGSFARTAVNFSAGAVSPVSSIITALLLVATLFWFAPLFYHLPKAILAAIIVLSASQLIDIPVIKRIFAFNLIDAVTFSCTFLAVLSFGVEIGILVGVAISFVLLIRSSSHPHIVVVGRLGETEHFRNVDRFETRTSESVIAVRVDQSLYFVNTRYVESYLLNAVADSPATTDLVLICNAMNFIDTSGLEMLEHLCDDLYDIGITLHLAEVKSVVMGQLNGTDFGDHMKGNIYLTTDLAMKDLETNEEGSYLN